MIVTDMSSSLAVHLQAVAALPRAQERAVSRFLKTFSVSTSTPAQHPLFHHPHPASFPHSCLHPHIFPHSSSYVVYWELLWLMLHQDPFTGSMTWLSWRSWWRWEWNGLLVKNERKDTVPTPEECDANTPCSIQDGKDPEFWPESMSPFYTLPTGARSCYNHVVMAGLQVNNINLLTVPLLVLIS